MGRGKFLICIAFVGVLFLDFDIVSAHVYLNDGNQHTIDYLIDDYLMIDQDTPGVGTRVDIVDGGSITNHVYAFEDSRVTVSGGTIGQSLTCKGNTQLAFLNGEARFISMEDSSQGTISNGIINRWVNTYGDSQLTFSGGVVKYDFLAYDGTVTMSGGLIERGMYASDALVTITGGEITESIEAANLSRVHIFDCIVHQNLEAYGQSEVIVSGGQFEGLIFAGTYSGYHSSIINFDGAGFAINGQDVNYGDFASNYAEVGIFTDSYGNDHSCLTGTITGVLSNGNTLDKTFYIFDEADITFIPEPCTVFLLGLGGLALSNKRRMQVRSSEGR